MPDETRSPTQDRRAREALRKLIDEMMAQLREAAKNDQWTPEERAQAERDLQRIMESVRTEALRGPKTGK